MPAKTKTKPRSLCLRSHEARRLAECGEVVVVREVKPQPEEGWASFGELPTCTCHPYGFHDSQRHHPCPLGPVGSPLVGKEAWARSPKGQIYRVDFDRGDGFGTAVVDLATGETIPLVWRSAVTMPISRSRFPNLIHAACEVKRAREDVTLDDVRAMGWSGQDMIAWCDMAFGFETWRDARWCWFSTVRNTEGPKP